jgi:hypothetical protein
VVDECGDSQNQGEEGSTSSPARAHLCVLGQVSVDSELNGIASVGLKPERGLRGYSGMEARRTSSF